MLVFYVSIAFCETILILIYLRSNLHRILNESVSDGFAVLSFWVSSLLRQNSAGYLKNLQLFYVPFPTLVKNRGTLPLHCSDKVE